MKKKNNKVYKNAITVYLTDETTILLNNVFAAIKNVSVKDKRFRIRKNYLVSYMLEFGPGLNIIEGLLRTNKFDIAAELLGLDKKE